MRHFVLACALLFCANVLHAAEEAEIKKLLPGTWIANIDKDGLKLTGETTFKADGSFSGNASIDHAGQKIKIDVEGTWSVKGDALESKVTKSSTPIMPVGTTTTDKIVEINDKTRKYKDAQGTEYTETRKKD